jgi:DNA helicase-2/ATP-dependent DNA helicase PcrA
VPLGMWGGTLHSFMLQVLRECYPNVQTQPDKLRKLTDLLFKGEPWRRGERWAIIKLVGLAKNEGVTLQTLSDPSLWDRFAEDINARHSVWSNVSGPGNVVKRARRMLEFCADCDQLPEHGIDFDDMIWLPYIYELKPIVPFDLLFIDECQDTNRVQQANALSLAERIVAVGDRNQAIFGFRGADTQAIDNLKDTLTERSGVTVGELPLTVCWRVPILGIQLAQQLVPEIQAAPNAIPGEIDHLSSGAIIKNAKAGDLILCRTNAPLIRATYNLWMARQPAYIKGRQIGQSLLTLTEQIVNDSECRDSIQEFDNGLEQRREADVRRALALPDGDRKAIDINERFDCLHEISRNSRSVTKLQEDLKLLFSDDDDSTKVCLSSVHRAKGLEANNVAILEPHLMPHPKAIKDWEMQQELNICYVSVTRFKKRLQFAGELPSILNPQED